ncbi:MAG TPA: hypothetical protein PKE57_01985 [Cellvibrionaceae bacterium]|nr:hypothetical protein [Cellvibrionaceae bacterium]HMW47196.1 hypothetical protein [Cellvibrionaceae bacterium]HMW70478.1 hypothetical protein [Cellvibrionaceae bacterium]HMY38717.1 hypothetical protein [Marinagarivorans sp.]HNG60545.1 hypothetical protein [Cellvibrionaceae bacterium]
MKKSRINLILSFAVLAFSGLALVLLAPSEDGLPHPLNGVLREIHGVGAAFGLFMFGYMFSDHVKKKLVRYRKTRAPRPWDGYLHLWLWVALIVSGLLLYYPQEIAGESPISMAKAHWLAGVGLIFLLPLHVGRNYIFNRAGK